MKYDRLYYNEEAFERLWLESFKHKKYIKELDEGLMGLTINPKSYYEMRNELIEYFSKKE